MKHFALLVATVAVTSAMTAEAQAPVAPLECRATNVALLGKAPANYQWDVAISKKVVRIMPSRNASVDRYAGIDSNPREVDDDFGPVLAGQVRGKGNATYSFAVERWEGDRAVIASGALELPGVTGSSVSVSCYPYNPNPTKTCANGSVVLASEACPA